MKFFTLWVIFVHFVYAHTITIDDREINVKHFIFDYYQDKDIKETITTIQDKNFTTIENKKTLHSKNSIWLRVEVYNSSSQKKEIYITYKNIHILRYLYFYILKDKKVVDELAYNNFDNIEIKNRIGNMVFYKLTLEPLETKEIYINAQTNSPIYYDIVFQDFENYSKHIKDTNILIIFLVGLLVAQGIYYLFLYFLTPYKEYIYFSGFIFSVSILSLYAYGGMAHYLGIYGKIGYAFNTLIYVTPLFTLLLFKSIFLDGAKFKKIKKVINIMIIFFIVMTIISTINHSNLVEGISLTKVGPAIFTIQLYMLFFISLYMYLKRVPMIGFFLLGYSVNVLTSTIAAMFFLGLIGYTEFTFHINSFGTFIESILFSVLLSYRIKQLNMLSVENSHKIDIQNSKLISMNEVIENISHQWRQPLSHINSAVLLIDDELYREEIENEAILQKLNEIENITGYMSKTIDDFKILYTREQDIEYFNLKAMIENILSTLNATLTYHHIELKTFLDDTLYMKAHKSKLQQSILVIINNAKDAILEKELQNPQIKINLYKEKDTIIIKIYDNAGGIDEEIADKIFEPYFTTKHKSKGTGLGLYISKKIVESEMDGTLDFQNEDDGTAFYIEFDRSR